jgi:(p)ppGpp synthase/HD superfamily hydrolase
MSLLLKRALDLAAVWHAPHRRKYPNADVPYISHCAGVAALLARHGFDDETCAAGALHDAIEDAGVTADRIAAELGPRIAALVVDVSEPDKSLPWEERKQRYLEHFRGAPWNAQAITLADKIDNFYSIAVCARHHGDPWAMFKRGREAQLTRFDALAAAVDALPSHPLIDEYRAALELVRAI